MKKLYFIVIIFLFGNLFSQEFNCGMTDNGGLLTASQRGGKWMTSHGTLNVLIVFVQFPDDDIDTTYSLWPTFPTSNNYPGPSFINTFIDSTINQNSTNGNMTNYMTEMSMGAFKFIGKTKFVVTPHTAQYYKNNYMGRWQINKEVLQYLDQSISFEEFDNWKRYSAYDIREEADGIVDDIFMIYRNIPGNLSGFEYDAESSLGDGGDDSFTVDFGQRRIYDGHPQLSHTGLGTTIIMGSKGIPYQGQIHEFAHHWMSDGGAYGHNGRGFWAMLNDWGVRRYSGKPSMINSFERELVGWHSPDSIYQTTYGITLTDYVQTNSSIKIKVPGSNLNEFFRLEYHLKLSQFDNPEMHDPTAKGLYLIHQKNIENPISDFKLLSADGRWHWEANTVVYPDYYPSGLPVYERAYVDRMNGSVDSRTTPFTWTGTLPAPILPNPSDIHFYKDLCTGDVIEKTIFLGDGNDAFGKEKNNPITPYSNPNTQNITHQKTWISIDIVNENTITGTITLNVLFDSTSATLLQPSKPQNIQVTKYGTAFSSNPKITWQSNIEPDIYGYQIYRSLEEGGYQSVFRKISTVSHNSGSDEQFYIDYNVRTSDKLRENLKYYYKIKAIDNQNKVSLFSDSCWISAVSGPIEKPNNQNNNLTFNYSLSDNFPNPFNPSTIIKFSISSKIIRQQTTTLLIYNNLGQQVAELVNKPLTAGNYEVQFNSGNLPSGIYYYRLQSGSYAETKKMILIK